MNQSLQARLVSYEPLWGIWNIEQAIEMDNFPNVYRLSNGTTNQKALIKVFTVNCKVSPSNEVRQKLECVCNELIKDKLGNYKNVATYQDYLINEVYKDNVMVVYDIVFRVRDYSVLSLEIKNGTKLSQDEVYNFLYDTSNVLCNVYNMDIIHGYITPQSILIDSDGMYNVSDFKIYDFMKGFNRTLYTAPELSNGNYSIQGDIYSLGMIAYQLLNDNVLPRLDDTYNLPPIRGIDDRLMNVVLTACNRDVSRRYVSMNQLLEDLKRLESVSFAQGQHHDSLDTELHYVSLTKPADNTSTIEPLQRQVVEKVTTESTSSMVMMLITILCIIVSILLILCGVGIYKGMHDDSDSIIASNDAIETTQPTQSDEQLETTMEIQETGSTTEKSTIQTTTTAGTTATILQTEERAEKTITVPPVTKKYYICKGDVDWYGAKYDAEVKGYQLATFTNEEEWDAIIDAAEQSGLTYLWIGGCSEIYNGVVDLYWYNGDDSDGLRYGSYVKWFVNKEGMSEPSGYDAGEDGSIIYEPNILLWHVTLNGQEWTLCDNSSELLNYYAGKDKIGYVYMD